MGRSPQRATSELARRIRPSAPDRLSREATLHRTLEYVLPGHAPQFESGRNPAGQGDELVIEQRHANLGRCRHAHLVRVSEVEAGKERLHVQVKELIEPCSPETFAR